MDNAENFYTGAGTHVYIKDELTNGVLADEVIEEFESYMPDHLLDEVEKVCSHVVVIREGIKLYSGRVDEMTASKGYFELKTENSQGKLKELLDNHDAISSVNQEDGKLIAVLIEELTATDLNAFLFKNGITLSHLVKRKPSLEKQFLTLTNNN